MHLSPMLISFMALLRPARFKDYVPASNKDRELRELRLKTEFYEDILNGLPNDLVVFDTEHRYLYLNAIAVRNSKTRRYMVGKTDYEYCMLKGMDGDLAMGRRLQFRQVVMNGSDKTWEEEKEKDGFIEVIRRTMRPVYDNLGQLKYVLGFATDVSSLRQTERRLREKLQELEQIMDNSFTAIAIADSNFKIMEWNKTAEKTFGYTQGDMIGTCPGENLLMHHNTAGADNFCLQFVLENNLLNKRFEADLKHKNGELLDVEVLINPFMIGERTYHAVFLHDITEKNRAQNAVQALATFPEENPNIVFRVSATDFSVIYANPATYKIFKSNEGIAGFLNTELRPSLHQTITSNTTVRKEAAYNNAHYTFAIWPNLADGYINLYATDITMLKKAKQQLVIMNEGLQEEVDKRTKELRESNKNLEHFAYSISHDLRAPIRHVLGYASLLIEEEGAKLTPESMEYLNRIRNSAHKMEKQISGLLQFSRYGTKKLEVEMVALKPRFDSAVEVFNDYYKPKELIYTNSADIQVSADPALLDTIIENLISNAIKYALPKGTVKISISANVTEHETVICICDNGVGFDMHYYHKIFGIFQRLHNDHEFEGMGIGLAHVQRIVERHGGRIWAESKLKEGSCFYLAFPTISAC